MGLVGSSGRKAIPSLLDSWRDFERPEHVPRSPAASQTCASYTRAPPVPRSRKRGERPAAGRETVSDGQKKVRLVHKHTSNLFVILFSSHLLYSPYCSLSLVAVTQIRGHIAGSYPPSPLRIMPLIFIAKILQPFLPSSTRVELRLPTLGALSC